jgi:hypothetical protein
MYPVFDVGFEAQITALAEISPYSEIYRMLQEIGPRIPLRTDGTLFLIINASNLIVIPWSVAIGREQWGDPNLGRTFLNRHGNDLYEDLREIIVEAESQANSRGESYISKPLARGHRLSHDGIAHSRPEYLGAITHDRRGTASCTELDNRKYYSYFFCRSPHRWCRSRFHYYWRQS